MKSRSDLAVLLKKPLFAVRVLSKYICKNLFGDTSLWAVSFASSYYCNFNCTHCYAKRFRESGKRPMLIDEKKHVIRECLEMGVVAFDFVGGEIGLSTDLRELIKTCNPKRTFISLASNGWIMNRENVNIFKWFGVDKICVSIDSFDEQAHDKFRNKQGSYKKCLEAVENIREGNLATAIITTISRDQTQTKPFVDLVKYSISNEIPLVFSSVIPFGELEGNTDILCDGQDIQIMKELHDKYPFTTRDCYENMGSYGCPAAKQVIYISEYGDVMPCAFLHVSFGNVLNEPIKTIRERMLKVPILNRYYQGCIASEDREFINKFLSAAKTSKTYPIPYEEIF